MECKLLKKDEIKLMEEVLIDDDMVFNEEFVEKFIENDNTYGFIVKDIDKIIGFAYGYRLIRPDGKAMFFLYSIGILPKYQNQGYGTKLMEYIINYAKEIGCYELFVMTDKGNTRACHLYEKFGGKNDYDDEIVYVINLEKEDK